MRGQLLVVQQTERAAAEALVKKRDMEAAAAAVIEAERRATESRAAEVYLLGKIRYVQVVLIACLGWCCFNFDAHTFLCICLSVFGLFRLVQRSFV